MSEQSILKQTLVWIAALLGASILWVGMLSLSSVLVVSRVLPEAPGGSRETVTSPVTSPTTPGAKPASSEPPSRTGASDETSSKRRNGLHGTLLSRTGFDRR